jgi:hypothetical protein
MHTSIQQIFKSVSEYAAPRDRFRYRFNKSIGTFKFPACVS